jgi:hypothetical protein
MTREGMGSDRGGVVGCSRGARVTTGKITKIAKKKDLIRLIKLITGNCN